MIVIDAANVVGSRPTGWWKDRSKAAGQFVERVRAAAAAGRLSTPVVVVLEGQARTGVREGVADGVEVVHAPGAGDDALAAVVETAPEPVLLVSSDRGLRTRVERLGAQVVGASWVWERLDTPRPSVQ
ncbi:MAG TPA: hypothetical protein VFV02_09035 [Acidimicrobiales bacterium]|nr:hypothetical protein [Acidimicrobiales bacterium]